MSCPTSILADVFDAALLSGDILACEALLDAFPHLLQIPWVRLNSRYRSVVKNCRTVRKSVSYTWTDAAPSKPQLHFEQASKITFKAAMQLNASQLSFPTFGRDIELLPVFSLRGWRWILDQVLELDGKKHAVWRRDKRASHLRLPRLAYHNAVSDCGCAVHHPLSVVCRACAGGESADTTARVAHALCATVSTVYRLTRCHHAGAASGELDAIYFTVPDEVRLWDSILDSPGLTPVLSGVSAVRNPLVLPCIKHLSVVYDIPFYRHSRRVESGQYK